jgi:hypothetical protein
MTNYLQNAEVNENDLISLKIINFKHFRGARTLEN